MKFVPAILVFLIGVAAPGQDLAKRAWTMESDGNGASAREMLEKAAQAADASPEALQAWADFAGRHHDPAARAAYERALEAAQGDARAALARRLVLLDLLADDTAAARKHLEIYRAAGGDGLTLPEPPAAPPAAAKTINIPGPLRGFARMAALAPELSPEETLPALARNVVTNGYQAASSKEALDQTEYLKLVFRYLSQAHELEKLAGQQQSIRIDNCESAQTGELLRVLGYRMRGGCGAEVVLETLNATRAFLTIDAGFPLATLEQSLRTNRPFEFAYKPTPVPVLYGPAFWLSANERQGGDFLEAFLSDPSLCRLYLGLSKLDPATAAALRKSVPAPKLRAYAHVLDFYGGLFEIRNGKAVVPGGARAEKAWTDLTGVSPEKGAPFFERLLSRDDGWLASYFDALLRINGPVQQYLTEPDRMKRFYAAVRGSVTSPGPARPVFRSNTDMMLLTTRLRLDPDGRPHVPGNLEIWRALFVEHPIGKYDKKLSRSASGWKTPDDVIEALFGLCRKSVDNEPLKIFLTLTDVNRRRATRLDPETAERMILSYKKLGSQYGLFAEFPEITAPTINAYLDAAESLEAIHDPAQRSDAAGSFQALTGLWQVFYRQGAIPGAEADTSLSALLRPFAEKLRTKREIFDAASSGVKTLLAATHSPQNANPQDRFLDLLAGVGNAPDSDVRTEMQQDMIRVFEAQRLISLQTIFDLAGNLERAAKGEKPDNALISKAASRIAEIQLPRSALSTAEKNTLSFGYWSEKHIEAQRKLNLRAWVDRAVADPKKAEDIRGLLAPFLRDTLVGLNYIAYAPPGAQILQTNPLFVRSHDFIGTSNTPQTWKETEVQGSGWPSSAGGKLVGSLAGLPYALAQAEQNFLIPAREQALIWGDLVPQMIMSATIPRWWKVSPAQLHWVSLHMGLAESALAESALNASRRAEVLASLERHAPPVRVYKVDSLLQTGNVRDAIENITPSEMFAIAGDLAGSKAISGAYAAEIHRMAQESPAFLNYAAISRAFGTPKPTLANSYSPELLNLRTFPTLMGYSSRIMAESWESNLLYYAAMADDLHLHPSQLNLMIPSWTQLTVERIFASHLEDWPALLRSLRSVGDDVRQRSRKQAAAGGGGF